MKPIRFLALATTVLILCVLLYEEGATGAANLNQEPATQAEKQTKVRKNKKAQKKEVVDEGKADEAKKQTQRTSAGVKNSPPNVEFLRELTAAAAEGGAHVLSSGDSYDDFVSVAENRNGAVFAAYAAYFDGHDQIRLHRRLADGWWTTRTYVPVAQARADIWMPQLAVDAKDRLWVIWSEQTGQSKGKTGNWDLYARPLLGDSWGDLVRLTDDPKPDINHHVATDAAGNIHVVWQGHAKNNHDVMYCRPAARSIRNAVETGVAVFRRGIVATGLGESEGTGDHRHAVRRLGRRDDHARTDLRRPPRTPPPRTSAPRRTVEDFEQRDRPFICPGGPLRDSSGWVKVRSMDASSVRSSDGRGVHPT
jgi:hypothetical protein